MKINWKKIIGITTAIFGTSFIAVSVVARKKKATVSIRMLQNRETQWKVKR